MESVLAPGRALDTLLEMKAEGYIRHIGAGVRSHEFHKELVETGHVDIILTFLDYTLLSQSASETTLPLARAARCRHHPRESIGYGKSDRSRTESRR